MNSFQFNKQWFNVIRTLKTPEARDKVFMAICELAFAGQLSDDNAIHTASTSKGIFQMIEQELLENQQTIDNKRNAQSKGGKKSAIQRKEKAADQYPELPLSPENTPVEDSSSNLKLVQVTSTRVRAHSSSFNDNNLYIDDKDNSEEKIIKENAREKKSGWFKTVDENIKRFNLEPVREKFMKWFEFLEKSDARSKLQPWPIESVFGMLMKESQGDISVIDDILQETLANGWITITIDRISQIKNRNNGKNINGHATTSRSDQLAKQTANIIGSIAQHQYPEYPPGMDVGGGYGYNTDQQPPAIPDGQFGNGGKPPADRH